MGPACLEANRAFRLRHTAVESHAAHHEPECAREFLRAVLLQLSAREVESCVADFERVPASLADCG